MLIKILDTSPYQIPPDGLALEQLQDEGKELGKIQGGGKVEEGQQLGDQVGTSPELNSATIFGSP